MRNLVPVLTVVAALLALWYVFAVVLNAAWSRDQATREDRVLTTAELVADTMTQERPRLPAPHQVAAELWKSIAGTRLSSKRNLLYHAWITISATGLGFFIGSGLGILLAAGIVLNRAMSNSVMPWMIASQTVPILAIAPMIIVVLNSVGISGLVPKSLISAYLSFFPVAVGMVKGLRSPDSIAMDQMRTWNAGTLQTFFKLRLPASLPYLFASLKVGVAASLVGAIVAELPVSQDGGLGARLLAGSYYGQTVQIWSALIVAAVLAALLVALIGFLQRLSLARTGMAP